METTDNVPRHPDGKQKKRMLFNPYNGQERNPLDVESDPDGLLMVDPTMPLYAANKETTWVTPADSDHRPTSIEDMRQRKEAAYAERNKLVLLLTSMFPSGRGFTVIEGWDAEWHNCIYVDLPTGQASWHIHVSELPLFEHLPQYKGVWDGHSTEEKYQRILDLANNVALTSPSTVFGTHDPHGVPLPLGQEVMGYWYVDRVWDFVTRTGDTFYIGANGIQLERPDFWTAQIHVKALDNVAG